MKHDILKKIEQDLTNSPARRTVDAQVAGHVFTLRVLKRSEEMEARSLVTADNLFQAFAESHVPQLAYAIQSIDGVDKAELFTPSNKQEQEAFDSAPRRWRASQLMDWLNDQEGVIVEKLWSAYTEIKDEGRTALEDVANFAKGAAPMDSGESAPSSSPEKES